MAASTADTMHSHFSHARATAAIVNSKIVLIDGPTLAELMIDFGLGVSTVNTYEIKRIDSDFFVED
jgi:restriction system protein